MPADKHRSTPGQEDRKQRTAGRENKSDQNSGKDRQPSQHRRPPAGRQYEDLSVDLGGEAEEERFLVRKAVFGLLVVVLIGIALYLVASMGTMEPPGEGRAATIAANLTHTVRVLDGRKETIEALARHTELRELAGRHGLFVAQLSDGMLALCAGRFSSPRDSEAQALLSRFRDFRVQDKPLFQNAYIWGYGPPNGK